MPARRNQNKPFIEYTQVIPLEGRISEGQSTYRKALRKAKPNGQSSFDFNLKSDQRNGFRDPAFAENKNLPIHRWVPWIAGFSSQFVEDCIDTFLNNQKGK